jgi:glutamine amidotransferase
MCLAIFKPAGKRVAKDSLRAGFYGNCSGSGFAYHEDGKLTVVKGLFTFNEFYEQYHAAELKHDMLVHFRAATHGPLNAANCHPFAMCNGSFAMIHNGIFQVDMRNRTLSDTGNFCEQILEPAILDGSYKDKEKIYAHPLWGWGVVVLMGATGEVIFYNEKMGSWDEGVWYSNQGYKWGRFSRAIHEFLSKKDAEVRPQERAAYIPYWEGD